MAGPADFTVEQGAGGVALALSGAWTIGRIGEASDRLADHRGAARAIDLSRVTRIDTVGAWLVHRASRALNAEIVGASERARSLIETVAATDDGEEHERVRQSRFRGTVAELGAAVQVALSTLIGLVGFLGAVVKALGSLIRHPGRVRWNAIVSRFDVVGVRALGIVGLMSFLIGIVIAQQGAVQLRQFGAEIYTINLVGRLTLRELGVLMTAIMVAGRSGSAFAAQLGTMKLTEEIDAMRTIGVSPIEALVVPRVLATVAMLPLLGFFASVVAIIGGGLLSWAALDIPPPTFFSRIREVVPITDVWVGLIKAPVFGLIIAVTGCYQGMLVEANAEEVGLRTTSAVVQAIFIVIVLDAFFAIFFSNIGWN